MTTRLYYLNAEQRHFDATVLRCETADGRARVVLDQTAFYPSSGGQPHDLGRLNDIPVLDVLDGDDGHVVHVLETPVGVGARVRGEIDWPRRFDHMQQHTGQHVLSAAFETRCQASTLSFHMGSETSSIDLSRDVGAAEIGEAEAFANRVVWDDVPVGVRFVSEAEARELPLRKPPARTGDIRLIDIAGVDLSACGGTHVARTGSIGMIAVTGWERFKGGVRVEFVCGARAVKSHAALRDIVASATRALSVAPEELIQGVDRLRGQVKDLHRTVRQQQDAILEYRAQTIGASATAVAPYSVVLQVEPDLDAAGLKTLATAIARHGGWVVALAGSGDPLPVVLARSEDVELDAAALLQELVASFGGRGGGRPDLAQGGLGASAPQFFDAVRRRLP
jgi:alanyl-tRNA synthetase